MHNMLVRIFIAVALASGAMETAIKAAIAAPLYEGAVPASVARIMYACHSLTSLILAFGTLLKGVK